MTSPIYVILSTATTMSSVAIVGGKTRVVDADGISIDEMVGNVSTSQDVLSVAHVTAAAGTSEPWLTLHYDEWICVTKGEVVISQVDKEPVSVKAGQTVMLTNGSRFQPTFPVDTEYVPVCLPAFRPDRCIREDTEPAGDAIAANLKKLHGQTAEPPAAPPAEKEAAPEVLYHMCPRAEWEAAKESGHAYFPATFEADDFLTHATGVPARLIDTANHYYQDSAGEWVCLEFTRTGLRHCGIFVRDEHATGVGDKPTSDDLMSTWVCPHIIGGIPVSVVTKERPMVRDGPAFVAIEGI
jgi:uncharacterized protein (DUF952 family)/mannose-6-phosphate isomerase-like protein (cupin superfamily)